MMTGLGEPELPQQPEGLKSPGPQPQGLWTTTTPTITGTMNKISHKDHEDYGNHKDHNYLCNPNNQKDHNDHKDHKD